MFRLRSISILPGVHPNLKRLASYSSSQSNHSLTIGIRREDPGRLWERRCPLSPSAVEELVREADVRVLVQGCDRRIFAAHEFEKAGAVLDPDLSKAHIILGIKEIPVVDLGHQYTFLPLTTHDNPASHIHVPRTHLMFSHTGKGQSYNMQLLSKFLRPYEETPSLIDYEFLTDGPAPGGKRVVAFGWYAGVAGAVEGLIASAHDFLSFGVASPFLHLPRPYMSGTVAGMRASLRMVGDFISQHGTPDPTGPFVITVTGNGNVAQGALNILSELPHVRVSPRDLPSLIYSQSPDLRKVYIVHAKPSDYIVPSDGSSRAFDRAAYYSRPSDWKSLFHERIAPYTTLLINGAGWQPGFPRLMTNAQLASALRAGQALSQHGRFRTVADVSCDIKGGLEFVERPTTIDSPFFISRPTSLPSSLPGVRVMSIDILPTQIPRDASEHFSSALMPFLRTLIRRYQGVLTSKDRDRLEALKRATITQNGELQGVYKWLSTPVEEFRRRQKPEATSSVVKSSAAQTESLSEKSEGTRMRKVLLMGSGMVARPAIEAFAKRMDVQLVVASNNVSEARAAMRGFPNTIFKHVDLENLTAVDALIREAEVVVSLLPVSFHPLVAKFCIENKKHMVTASYISPAMKELHDRALAADVLLLNEIGLDPGIDHCSAISLLQRVRSTRKRVRSFISFCGGLPAPEDADVPLGYKFSWSPRGVLSAALNDARFKLMGQEYNIHGEDLLRSRFRDVPLSNYLRFEGIANRDSLPYTKTYDLGPLDSLDTVLRGTLRYPGFCSLMHAFKRIGLLETQRPLLLDRWSSLAPQSLASKFAIRLADDDLPSFYSALTDIVDIPKHELSALLDAIAWLGIGPSNNELTGDAAPATAVPSTQMAPIDLLTMALAEKLRYRPNERDMVVLMHEITASPYLASASPSSTSSAPVEEEEEAYTSTLIAYGTPTASAMSRTVGLPVALATMTILDGRVRARGVHGPTMEDMYRPVLQGLEENGLVMKETVRRGGGSRKALRGELMKSLNTENRV